MLWDGRYEGFSEFHAQVVTNRCDITHHVSYVTCHVYFTRPYPLSKAHPLFSQCNMAQDPISCPLNIVVCDLCYIEFTETKTHSHISAWECLRAHHFIRCMRRVDWHSSDACKTQTKQTCHHKRIQSPCTWLSAISTSSTWIAKALASSWSKTRPRCRRSCLWGCCSTWWV